MPSEELVVDVSQDWAMACGVQERFMQLPGEDIDSVSFSARCRQARALGGDCYDFTPRADGRLAVTIGDASGKGLAAALMISNVQSSLRTAAFFAGDDLATMIGAVNRQVYASCNADRYATLFYGVFDRATRVLRYVNAGHNPPLVVHADGWIERLEASGPPVGIFADSTYEEYTAQLGDGDLVIAYTDGVVESVNAIDEEWGVDGLLAAVAASERCDSDKVVEAVFSSLDEFSEGRQGDDATVAVLLPH